MLSKEQVLEIITYCNRHGVQRKARLKELGISEWNFYESRRRYLRQERKDSGTSGTFIQLGYGGEFIPASVTEVEHQINPGRQQSVRADDLTVECQTSRGGIVRVNGKISAELLSALVKSL